MNKRTWPTYGKWACKSYFKIQYVGHEIKYIWMWIVCMGGITCENEVIVCKNKK